MTSYSPVSRLPLSIICIVFMLVLFFPSGAALAQHEPSGGSIKDVAGGPVSTPVKEGRAPVKEPPRRSTPPVRRRPVAPKSKGMDADDYYEEGNKFLNAKQYSEAIEAYNNAIKLNPRFAEAFYGIGWIHNDQRNYELAVDALTKALRFKPDYPDALIELGYSQRNLKQAGLCLS